MSEPPLRVAMLSRRVHPAHGPGGMERKVYDLATRLAAAGVSVDLLTETPGDEARMVAAAEAMPDGVIIHWVPGRWLPIGDRRGTVVLDRITNYPLWARRAARWAIAMRDDPPTVFHAHGLATWGFVGAPATAPLVMSVEGLEEFEVPAGAKRIGYAPFRSWMRRAAATADAVIATDRALQPVVERHLGIAAERQEMIPNAIDTEACRGLADPRRGAAMLNELGVQDATPLFVSIGRLEANKGFEVLVEAFGRCAAQLPERWAWVLIGQGPLHSTLEAAAARAGIAENFRLAGALPDVDLHSLATVADWFVHPTLYEGSSLVTLEAMAHGLPVIASDAGGLPDKVIDNETGFLVPPGDPDALAATLLRAASMDGTALGEAGSRYGDANFSWDAVIGRYIEVYREVATTASPPNR